MNSIEEATLYDLSDHLGVEIYVLGVGEDMFLPRQQSAPCTVHTEKGATAEWMEAAITRPADNLWWTHTHPSMGAFFSQQDVSGAHALWEMVCRPIHATVLGKDAAKHEETIDETWIAQHPALPPLPEHTYNTRWDNRLKKWVPTGGNFYADQERWRNGELWGDDWDPTQHRSRILQSQDVPTMGDAFWTWIQGGGVVPPNFWTWGRKRQAKWWHKQQAMPRDVIHTTLSGREPTLESDINWILEEYGQDKLLETLDKMNVITLIRNLEKPK